MPLTSDWGVSTCLRTHETKVLSESEYIFARRVDSSALVFSYVFHRTDTHLKVLSLTCSFCGGDNPCLCGTSELNTGPESYGGPERCTVPVKGTDTHNLVSPKWVEEQDNFLKTVFKKSQDRH